MFRHGRLNHGQGSNYGDGLRLVLEGENGVGMMGCN